jgi:hypothetical protein
VGFGVRDLLTVTVTFLDRAIAVMASVWPTGELAGDGPVVLTAAELDAAAALGDATMPAALGLSPQQERALGWATGAVADVLDHPQSPFWALSTCCPPRPGSAGELDAAVAHSRNP